MVEPTQLPRLVQHFEHFLVAYDSSVSVTSAALEAHRATLALRREVGTIDKAVASKAFAASLRETLVAWGLDVRGSQLVDLKEFWAALNAVSAELIELEPLRIDDDVHPSDLPQRLWTLIDRLGVTPNKAKIVAGSKTLHHLLPELVPPMDRRYTGAFFGLRHQWQGDYQGDAFVHMFSTMAKVARETRAREFVRPNGWRSCVTKNIDNAIIGYLGSARQDAARISIEVSGLPPAKSETKSMLSDAHAHSGRVRALLESVHRALQAQPAFVPPAHGPVGLDLVLHVASPLASWDATDYLGGVADVLQGKANRGLALDHLGELADVRLYRDDRQIKRITYVELPSSWDGYLLTVRVL